jgi:2-polyprenyl-3-methyl-5-hydroxy-6-metoxy-1,4-benzoquinol methylase
MEFSHSKLQLEYYQNHSSEYEKENFIKRKPNRLFKRKVKIVNKCLKNQFKEDINILEIGAGTGLFTYFAIQHLRFSKYVCSDLSNSMLKIAETRIAESNLDVKGVTFEIYNLLETPKFESKYDIVIGIDVLHHLDDPINALKKLSAQVNKGGKLIFIETNIYNPISLYRIIGKEHEMRALLNTTLNFSDWLNLAGLPKYTINYAPAFTPSCPKILEPFFDFIDLFLSKIKFLKKISALIVLDVKV